MVESIVWPVSSVGRAYALCSRGCRFKSRKGQFIFLFFFLVRNVQFRIYYGLGDPSHARCPHVRVLHVLGCKVKAVKLFHIDTRGRFHLGVVRGYACVRKANANL